MGDANSKVLEAPDRDANDAAITGVRVALPNAGETGVPSDEPQRFPLESWDADEALESVPPVVKGELLGGKYVVEGMFAEGGMGIVCLGRHAQLNQPVAIKFLRRALSGKDSIIERFLNEARALAALRSEHVVRVMDVGQLESGRPYLVMEHLDGIDLSALIERDGPLGVDKAVSYVLQVCDALAEAHALGIVHRDIKPENLFLWSGGTGNDVVKVLDFGLAKRLGPGHALGATGPQDSMGSPWYMSPEQIVTPQLVDSRTDVWSLGVVLYQLLTGSVPFEGTNVGEVFSRVLTAAPRSLFDVLPSVGVELDAIVRKCLEKAPRERYSTISELAGALNDYVARRADETPDALPEAAQPSPDSAPSSPAEDDTKIRIPGVHARWPGVLVALTLMAGAGIYFADRTGRVRVRDFTDGRVTPALLGIDAPLPSPRSGYEPPVNVALGVVAVAPVVGASGTPTVRAEREPDLEPGKSASEDAAATDPMSDAERDRRQVRYREFLKSQGMTPLRDALSE